jgi:hypothetical protein
MPRLALKMQPTMPRTLSRNRLVVCLSTFSRVLRLTRRASSTRTARPSAALSRVTPRILLATPSATTARSSMMMVILLAAASFFPRTSFPMSLRAAMPNLSYLLSISLRA